MTRFRLLAVVATVVLAGCASLSPGRAALPATIHECEAGRARICGTWTLEGGRYRARWENGATAVITVPRFDANRVTLARDDYAGTSAGMTALYEGTVSGRTVRDGRVTWRQGGNEWRGTWEAEW
jgi:hypothetical protein